MAAYDDLNVKRIAVISVISVLVTAVTVLAVQVLYFAMAEIVDERKTRSSAYTRQIAELEEQAADVSRYGVDPETGNVVIPVEAAMKAMAETAEPTEDEA